MKTLISETEIQFRIEELAREIEATYASDNLLLVGVLNGAFIFMADLIRQIKLSNVSCEFIQFSSYGDRTTSGQLVKEVKGVDFPVVNMNVLLVEDILDTGNTLSQTNILQRFTDLGAKSVRLCVLLNKPTRRMSDIVPDFVGFSIEDHFVVGYGLDYAGRYRGLKEILILENAKF